MLFAAFRCQQVHPDRALSLRKSPPSLSASAVRINLQKLTTNTPSLAQHTLLSSRKCESLRLAQRVSLAQRPSHRDQKKPQNLCWPWPCELNVKSYWQVLHQDHYLLHNSEEAGIAELQQETQPWSMSCWLPSTTAPHRSRENHNSGIYNLLTTPPSPAAGDKSKLTVCFQEFFQSWNLSSFLQCRVLWENRLSSRSWSLFSFPGEVSPAQQTQSCLHSSLSNPTFPGWRFAGIHSSHIHSLTSV